MPTHRNMARCLPSLDGCHQGMKSLNTREGVGKIMKRHTRGLILPEDQHPGRRNLR